MIRVNLEEFILSGEFGPVKPGMSSDELVGIIGKTDIWAPISRKNRNIGILKYGDIEFFFNEDKLLYMIFIENFSVPAGDHNLIIEAGRFTSSLQKREAEKILNGAGITYTEIPDSYNENCIRIIAESGAELIFCGDDEKQMPALDLIMLKKELKLKNPHKQINISVPLCVYECLKEIARNQNISVSKLCRSWIIERVEKKTDSNGFC